MNPILPRMYDSDEIPPAQILGYVSVKGASTPFEGKEALRSPLKAYHGKKADRDEVEKQLVKAGFMILSSSPLGFGVSGPPAAYEELSGGKLQTSEVMTRVVGGAHRYVSRLYLVGPHQPEAFGLGLPKSKAMKVDGIVLEKPRYPHASLLTTGDPSPFPLSVSKFQVTVLTGVATALSAQPVNQGGNRGSGVRVAMIDTGFYRHPFFLARSTRSSRCKRCCLGRAPPRTRSATARESRPTSSPPRRRLNSTESAPATTQGSSLAPSTGSCGPRHGHQTARHYLFVGQQLRLPAVVRRRIPGDRPVGRGLGTGDPALAGHGDRRDFLGGQRPLRGRAAGAWGDRRRRHVHGVRHQLARPTTPAGFIPLGLAEWTYPPSVAWSASCPVRSTSCFQYRRAASSTSRRARTRPRRWVTGRRRTTVGRCSRAPQPPRFSSPG